MRENSNELPFIVYAIDTPTYSEHMFGCRCMDSRLQTPFYFQGSALVISGGYWKASTENIDEVLIRRTGLIERVGATGQRFAEEVVVSMLDPDDRVLVYYDRKWSSCCDWATIAERSGFNVFKTDRVIICLGKAHLLPKLQWLEGALEGCDTHLIASAENESSYELDIISAAQKGHDVFELAADFWDRMFKNPNAVSKELGGYKLFTSLGGVEQGDLAINRPETDIGNLGGILEAIAARLNVTLFDAGKLSDLDSSGYFFGDSTHWDFNWRSIPDDWRRVIVGGCK